MTNILLRVFVPSGVQKAEIKLNRRPKDSEMIVAVLMKCFELPVSHENVYFCALVSLSVHVELQQWPC